ncbi:MAG: hypothetical protein A2140_08395 [Candidatus Muproteobacteria bacterium RBG_16_62_13]|uniref:Uncharacterized protein n=1 Tax=Candidatus Muproteobacteria bacterium RBG_16_62_13 TaxID=1817756 RepID=A0A1F6SWJ8_9PROT|nr:MAG: hypothetical protein A2140_08395 [Candidatus Muproteobacteria bacterium RBG_16_62_13]
MAEQPDQKPQTKALKPEAIELMMQMSAEKRVVAPPLLRYSTNVGILFFALALVYSFAEWIYGKQPMAGGVALFASLMTFTACIGLRMMRRWGALIFLLFLILDAIAITLLVSKGVTGLGTIAMAVTLKLIILAAVVMHWHELR